MSKPRRILIKVVYWLVVLALSVVVLFLLINFLESRDESQVGPGGDGVFLLRL